MGISGLLPLLKSITETKTIDQYRGQTLAIDGYCWLHRAIYSCSQEICLGEETDKYIVYFIDRVNALLQHGVTPYVVFDGGPLPMKKATEEERRKSRAKNRELGLASLRQKNYSDARKYFVRAADVSPYMAHCVIQRLKAMDVQFVVAPYEADAQLAFLMKNGIVDGVITEDSDCLPFGCAKVLFKMDRDGIAQEVQTQNLKHNAGLSFHMFTDEMFLEMCIFSGCDYLASLPGFALKKAYALIKQHGTHIKILRALRMEGKVRIPATYEAEFERAILTFRHQRVYDSATKKLVPLTSIPTELLEKDPAMEFLGPIIADDVAQAIAEGDMDPMTLTVFSGPPQPRSNSGHPQSTFAHASNVPTTNSSFKPARTAHYSKPPTAFSSSVAAPAAARVPNRNLPAWMCRKAHQLANTSSTTSPPRVAAAAAAASTPKTISHFFAAARDGSKLSPADEATKSSSSAVVIAPPNGPLSRQQSTESMTSSFESQEPVEVNVARSMTFSPLDEQRKGLHHSHYDASVSIRENEKEKENAVPNMRQSAPAPSTAPAAQGPPAKSDDAFARMMRAGTTLQKYSLKRKASVQITSSSSINRFSFGGYGRSQVGEVLSTSSSTVEQRIKRHAFARTATTPEVAVEPEAELSGNKESLVEQEEDESCSCEQQQPYITRSASVFSERLRGKEPEPAVHASSPRQQQAPQSVKTPVDAFARFRFGSK